MKKFEEVCLSSKTLLKWKNLRYSMNIVAEWVKEKGFMNYTTSMVWKELLSASLLLLYLLV